MIEQGSVYYSPVHQRYKVFYCLDIMCIFIILIQLAALSVHIVNKGEKQRSQIQEEMKDLS